MKNRDEMRSFLSEGIARYASARQAVDTFERETQQRLMDIVEAKRDWQHFRPKTGPRGRAGAINASCWSGTIGQMIFASLNSEKEDDGSVELRLWWESTRSPDGVLLCCGRMLPGYRLRNITLPDPKPGVVCGPIEKNKPWLYMEFTSDSDLESCGRLLLDEMDRALGLG